MATTSLSLQAATNVSSAERSIVFVADIHPFHILQSKVETIKSDFIWCLRESTINNVINVDYFRSEKVMADGKATVTWKYYSIPYGLKKNSWEVINVNDEGLLQSLTKITPHNALQHVQALLHKLEKLNVAKLNLIPEIDKLMQFEKECVQQTSSAPKKASNDLFCTTEFRLNPIEKHAAVSNSVYIECSMKNLDQMALIHAINSGVPRKGIFARIADYFIEMFE